jgi:hypothetical protein
MPIGIVTRAASGMGAVCAAPVVDMFDVLVFVDGKEVLLDTQARRASSPASTSRSTVASWRPSAAVGWH